MNRLPLIFGVFMLVGCIGHKPSAANSAKRDQRSPVILAPPDFEKLIDQFTETSAEGFGYSTTLTGTAFAPDADAAQVQMLLLGGKRPEPSVAMELLVRQGVPAVDPLLKHLDDARLTRMTPVKGMMWTAYLDEYDYNRRTSQAAPVGVNKADSETAAAAEAHSVTVGDLCFVALGQIVNRRFNAYRYQPTGGVVISSPTQSAALCAAARRDFAGLTVARHRAMLVDDFLHPEYEDRRTGALQCLAFYYPDDASRLFVRQLDVPTFDIQICWSLLHDQLYKEDSAEKRQRLFDQFVQIHGPPASDGVLLQLFSDLENQIADEEHRISPPLNGAYHARQCLIEFYHYTMDVKPEDRPYVNSWETDERARFIASFKTHDERCLEAVHSILLQSKGTDDYTAANCVTCLIGHGYDAELKVICQEGIARTKKSGDRWNQYEELLAKIDAPKATSQ